MFVGRGSCGECSEPLATTKNTRNERGFTSCGKKESLCRARLQPLKSVKRLFPQPLKPLRLRFAALAQTAVYFLDGLTRGTAFAF